MKRACFWLIHSSKDLHAHFSFHLENQTMHIFLIVFRLGQRQTVATIEKIMVHIRNCSLQSRHFLQYP